MSLRVNHNVPALRSHSDLVGVSQRLNKSVERLSSGLRINRAADDAAGLTISEKLRRQVRGLARATMNAQDGISMIQTAEGALNETHSILHRMRELAIQSANDTLTSMDRNEIQKEVNQLKADLDRIAYNTEFNTKRLLDGSQSAIISTSSVAARGLVSGDAPVGGDYKISLALLKSGSAQMQRTQIFNLVGSDSSLADGGTKLHSISQFYDANGVFVLDQPQILTLHGNTRTAEVVVDAQMDLNYFAGEIQNALLDLDDGLAIDNSYTRVIGTTQTSTSGMGGYIELVSGFVGDAGKITVAGDQRLIDGLGFSTIRAAENNFVHVNLTDKDGKTRSTETEAGRAVGLLEGIDIQFESQPAQIAGSRGLSQGLVFTVVDSFTVEAGGQTIDLLIGTGYRTLEGITRSINAQAATVAGAFSLRGLEAKVIDGQIRLTYEKPASVASTAPNYIKITNASNSTTLGFNNGTYGGFADGSKNEDAVRWGFSKFSKNIASGEFSCIRFSDGIGTVIVNICTAISDVSGSVTLADMVDFEALKADLNQRFIDATVGLRVDQIDNTMLITSTRLGRSERSYYGNVYSSIVTMEVSTVTGGLASATESLFQMFDLSAGTRSGKGDTAFRMHVKTNDPQYHIGANQEEVMKISMAEMTANALGVDNLDMTSIEGAEDAIGRLNIAINKVSSERSKLGAYQNRLEYAVNNLRNMHSNATASESRIRDLDMADEMIKFTSSQVMRESAMAMVAQANSASAGILQLLQ